MQLERPKKWQKDKKKKKKKKKPQNRAMDEAGLADAKFWGLMGT